MCGLVYYWDNHVFCTNDSGETTGAATSPNIWAFGQWQMFTAVRDSSGNYTFYVDGQQSGPTSQYGGSFPNFNYASDLGSNLGEHYFFNGILDDMRVYNRMLSGTEVAALY